MLVEFWRHAQKRWGHGQLVSDEDMKSWDWGALIESRWAIQRKDGYYAIGSEQRFAWYLQRCKAASIGGKVRSNASRDGSGRFRQKPIKDPAGHQPDTSRDQPTTSPLTLTLKERDCSETSQSSSGEEIKSPGEHLFRIWNENRGSLPEVKILSPKRRKRATSRFGEIPDPDYWARVVKKLSASPFCRGDSSGGWVANFDFLLQPDTHIKAIEGQYDRGMVNEINTIPIRFGKSHESG